MQANSFLYSQILHYQVNGGALHLAHSLLSLGALFLLLLALVVCIGELEQKKLMPDLRDWIKNMKFMDRKSTTPVESSTSSIKIDSENSPTIPDTKHGYVHVTGTVLIFMLCATWVVLLWGYVQDRVMRQLPNGVWYIATQTTPVPVTSEDDIAVVAVWNPYRYTWQKVDKANNLIPDTKVHRTRFTRDICPDYTSPVEDFTVGTVLNQMIHTDEGSCWSLNPDKHCGYYKRRVNDKPVLANLTEIGDMQ